MRQGGDMENCSLTQTDGSLLSEMSTGGSWLGWGILHLVLSLRTFEMPSCFQVATLKTLLVGDSGERFSLGSNIWIGQPLDGG